MRLYQSLVMAAALSAISSFGLAAQGAAGKQEKENVQQVPQKETYPGRVTGETPSADPGGVRGTAPPHPGAGEPQESVTVTPPGHRTPGAAPGTVTAVEPRGAFGELDKDRSGFLEQEEAKGIVGLDFKSADADRDDRLSLSEFEAASRKGHGSSDTQGTTQSPETSPGRPGTSTESPGTTR